MRRVKQFIAKIKARFIHLEGYWRDELIWCPSQCYFEFDYKGIHYSIYLKLWNNPWTCDLIKNFSPTGNDPTDAIEIPVRFYTHKELEPLKKEAIQKVKLYLAGYYGKEAAQ